MRIYYARNFHVELHRIPQDSRHGIRKKEDTIEGAISHWKMVRERIYQEEHDQSIAADEDFESWWITLTDDQNADSEIRFGRQAARYGSALESIARLQALGRSWERGQQFWAEAIGKVSVAYYAWGNENRLNADCFETWLYVLTQTNREKGHQIKFTGDSTPDIEDLSNWIRYSTVWKTSLRNWRRFRAVCPLPGSREPRGKRRRAATG
ncbi:MAG: hypothetical protein ACI8UO_003151 [Verrucomicrobiales bacterium]|jgi:hypothetical protein